MVVGARQSFQFFRQKNLKFLENNRALSKFLYGVSHYLISCQIITKSVHKKPSHLKESLVPIYRVCNDIAFISLTK